MRPLRAALLIVLAGCAQGTERGGDDDPIDAPVGLVDAPQPDAAATDAAATDAAPDASIDSGIDAGGVTNADTCVNPPDITAAAMQGTGTVITGNLTGHTNDIQPASTCTMFTNDGPDDIYVLNLPTAGRTITASVDAPTWDSAIEIVQMCTMTPTCFVGRDAGNPESVTYTTTAAGIFYVVVDSWDVGAFGPYTLTVRVQ